MKLHSVSANVAAVGRNRTQSFKLTNPDLSFLKRGVMLTLVCANTDETITPGKTGNLLL
jgi:hypothetical protein